MSVLVSKRKDSSLEVLIKSIELHNMLIEFMQRNFGIKDLEHFVQLRYAYGEDDKEDYSKYRFLLFESKRRINYIASSLTGNLRSANSIYPTNLMECDKRRSYQTEGILDCELLIKELQHLIDIFYVDINVYKRYVEAIDKEIGLIKNWRQKDNKIRSRFSG